MRLKVFLGISTFILTTAIQAAVTNPATQTRCAYIAEDTQAAANAACATIQASLKSQVESNWCKSGYPNRNYEVNTLTNGACEKVPASTCGYTVSGTIAAAARTSVTYTCKYYTQFVYTCPSSISFTNGVMNVPTGWKEAGKTFAPGKENFTGSVPFQTGGALSQTVGTTYPQCMYDLAGVVGAQITNKPVTGAANTGCAGSGYQITCKQY